MGITYKNKWELRTLLIAILIFINNGLYAKKIEWNVFDYGAKGDGIALDTKAIQKAIDLCHEAGGGVVRLANGCFLSGSIFLKDNVELRIETGAKLLGSLRSEDYRLIQDSISLDNYNAGKALIYGEGVSNISITGNGTIDGNGEYLTKKNEIRAHIIHLKSCDQVKVKDITLKNGSWWIQKYHLCNHLTIDGVRVDSKENQNMLHPRYADAPGRNTDGCNIVDSKNVQISNCNIFSGDDGIVLKSFSQTGSCHNVTITNCIISTNASGIKIGTETAGDFHDIVINNCVVYDTRLGGIELISVDGAKLERIMVTNISMNNVQGAAIFIRLANRARKYNNELEPTVGQLKDVIISNIMGKNIGRYGCTLTGIPQRDIENIVLDNINLSFEGGENSLYFEGYPDKPVKELTVDNVPECEKDYPRCDIFGKLPAYGFYIRHAKGIELNNIKLSFDKKEIRPAIIADDVERLTVKQLYAQGTPQTNSLLHFRNVRRGIVNNSSCFGNVPVFLHLSGMETDNVQCRNNFIEKPTKEIVNK